MKIYLASPLFTCPQRNRIYDIADSLRHSGHEVYVPMEHQIESGWKMKNSEWAEKVFAEDIKAIQECDVVWAIYYGLYSDSGTAWECGYAYGIGKPVHLVDRSKDDVSLMVINGSKNKEEFYKKEQS